jgi:hypothetical protein
MLGRDCRRMHAGIGTSPGAGSVEGAVGLVGGKWMERQQGSCHLGL